MKLKFIRFKVRNEFEKDNVNKEENDRYPVRSGVTTAENEKHVSKYI